MLLKARDSEGSGEIPVKAFSECLRSWDSGDGSPRHAGGGDKDNGGDRSEALTHADRKVLYRRWAVKGWVRYDDFLGANGYYDALLPRYSNVSTAVPAAVAAAAAASAAPAATPVLSAGNKRGTRSSLGRAGVGAADKGGEEEEESGLLTRARIVLVHLSEVCCGRARERVRVMDVKR